MPYITSIERLARAEGLQAGIALALKIKFGAASKKLLRKIQAIQDIAKLQILMDAVETAETLEDFQSLLRQREAQ